MGIVGRSKGTNAVLALGIAVALAAAAMLSGDPVTGNAEGALEPWVPETPETVVLQIEGADELKGLVELRQRLAAKPDNVAAASLYARLALQHYAATGDARFLGFAEGAIRHWKDERSPPAPVWLIRGRILQTKHLFLQAAEDLDRMRETYPESVEATLLAADAWRRAGMIGKASSRCASLAVAGYADFARFCAADVYLSIGDAENAFLAASTGRAAGGAPQWKHAVVADAAAAAGRLSFAEASYQKALALPGAGIALYVAYADLLLSVERPREVIELLAEQPGSDAVVLRRAIAAKALGLDEFDAYRRQLLDSFADARALGAARLHLREQAIFELHIEHDASAALRLARQNWEIQKGPEDAGILLQAAEAVGAPDAAQTVFAWRQQFRRDSG